MLTVFFTALFTALTVLCAAYVVKSVQFYKARARQSGERDAIYLSHRQNS